MVKRPSTQATEYLITTIVLAVTTLVVVIRFISRYTRKIGIGLDDIFLYAAWFVFLINGILNVVSVRLGAGDHYQDISKENWPRVFLLVFFISPIIYTISITLVKFAVLFLYRRIFLSKDIRRVTLALGILVLLLLVANEGVTIFSCYPITHPSRQNCLDFQDVLVANAISNIVSEVLVLLLPLPAIWRLQASYTKRMMIMITLLSGCLTVAISIYRFTTLYQIDEADPAYQTSESQTWGVVESGTGIVTASMPALMPVVTFFTRQCKALFKHKLLSLRNDNSRDHRSDVFSSFTIAKQQQQQQQRHAAAAGPATSTSTTTTAGNTNGNVNDDALTTTSTMNMNLDDIGLLRSPAIWDATLAGSTHVSTRGSDAPRTPIDGSLVEGQSQYDEADKGNIRVKQTVTIAESRSAPRQ